MIGQQAGFSLLPPLLLLHSELGPAVAVSTAAAEEDENSPEQPEP